MVAQTLQIMVFGIERRNQNHQGVSGDTYGPVSALVIADLITLKSAVSWDGAGVHGALWVQFLDE